MRRHRHVVEVSRAVAERYGYLLMATPIMEFTEVFKRTIGEATDIVTKEMYSFAIGEGDSITLRPENTAGVARAFLSNGLAQELPLKYFYAGPMFRHERPQKGRQRQFHQIGVELFGVPGAAGDVEVIAAGARILDELGLLSQTTLELNTLGDAESRQAYRAALVDYFQDHRAKLSEDSLSRLDRNPLRILDSKDAGDRAVVADAPSYGDYLTSTAKDFFASVRSGLEALDIAYVLNPRLVRGLDYYCHTAFEFTTEALGAQGTVMGGGRYDYLVETMGGQPTPGVGWAAGIERMAMLLAEDPPAPRPFALVPIGAAAEARARLLAESLRREGFTVDLAFSGNLRKRMRRADKLGARAALVLGDDELAQEAIVLRDLDSGQQSTLALERLSQELKALA